MAERRRIRDDLIGLRREVSIGWEPADAVLFALATGADPLTDLDYLDIGRGPHVLPTFPFIRAARGGQDSLGLDDVGAELDEAFFLSFEASIAGHVPPSAHATNVVEYVEVCDKGSSAIVVAENRVEIDGQALIDVRMSMMFRGQGGFGGERGPSRAPPRQLEPDIEVPVDVPRSSSVLYELVGESNPHTFDPEFAARIGLPGPISAGQVLVGAAARTITATLAEGDHRRLSRITVDFASPHVTGEPLTMRAQRSGSDAVDFTVHSGDQPVLLGGRAELA